MNKKRGLTSVQVGDYIESGGANCPECGEVIGTTKEEALKFFRGK